MGGIGSGLALALLAAALSPSGASAAEDAAALKAKAEAVAPQVVAWRRDIHEHPELGNQETRTAGIVAEHLRSLGYEVREHVGATGVVAVLRAGKPGPVVALRADMDALPVKEAVDLPFASKVTADWGGAQVGVMHACGHDGHTAMLLGAADVLAGMKNDLAGTVLLIFQPAEESLPTGEIAGSRRMLAECAFDDPKPDVVFGLHLMSNQNTGVIGYRSGAVLASSDTFEVKVTGKQTHGAMPWNGVDPIVIGSQIVLGFQTIQSRQVNVTDEPSVLTVGTFDAGTRHNIIPGEATMTGTLRTYDEDMRAFIKERMKNTASLIAQSGGGSAEVTFKPGGYAATVNDPSLTEEMLPVLAAIPGTMTLVEMPKQTPSEDFSFYAQRVPGMFVMIGATPPGIDPSTAAPNHSPNFFVDEAALPIGVEALLNLTLGYMDMNPAKG